MHSAAVLVVALALTGCRGRTIAESGRFNRDGPRLRLQILICVEEAEPLLLVPGPDLVQSLLQLLKLLRLILICLVCLAGNHELADEGLALGVSLGVLKDLARDKVVLGQVQS